MKKRLFTVLSFVLVSGVMLAGCANSSQDNVSDDSLVSTRDDSSESSDNSAPPSEDVSTENSSAAEDTDKQAAELTAQFGYGGKSFTLYLYDNDTAAAIARHVGTSSWNLPIYHYDDFDNWEVMQYYDIPSRYEIPSVAEEITSEKAGEVYYSEPNRIILFYQDAEVSAEYTPVGYFDATDEFIEAVENNPVLEGWGNKIISISDGD
ncbi:MAG: cyclophilin-like fold protein [Lachnospiraceae bacterium]|nr:cyclophilin-like fold protein [Muribaculaceae bacterium]MCM1412495.1 cyclophilin-like fold protein [Lachnospiraceae bacterium]